MAENTTGWGYLSQVHSPYARMVGNSDGSYYVSGLSTSAAWGGPALAKIGGDGVIQWAKMFSDPYWGQSGGAALDETSDGGVIVEPSWDGNGGGWKTAIAKIDANGAMVWQYDTSFGGELLVAGDSLYIAGNNQRLDGAWEIRLAKLDLLSMSFTWAKAFEYPVRVDLANIRLDSDGGVLLLGGSTPGAVILKVSSTGSVVLSKLLSSVQVMDIASLSDGYAFAGTTNQGAGAGDLWVAKVSTSWGFRWQRALGGCNGEEGDRIVSMNDGSLMIGAWVSSGTVDGGDVWGVNVRSTNNWGINWQKRYWTLDGEDCQGLSPASDGGMTLFSSTSFLAKTDASGAISSTGCSGTILCPAVTNTSFAATTTTATISNYPAAAVSDFAPALTSSSYALEDAGVQSNKPCGN